MMVFWVSVTLIVVLMTGCGEGWNQKDPDSILGSTEDKRTVLQGGLVVPA